MIKAPEGSDSLFASTLTPSLSSSPDTTVYEHTSFFASSPVLPLRAHVAVLSAVPTLIVNCGVPVTTIALSNVTVTSRTSPVV